MELGSVAEGRNPELYPSTTSHLGEGLGEGQSTKPHNFKSLKAVGIDNPRLEWVESGGWGTQNLG